MADMADLIVEEVQCDYRQDTVSEHESELALVTVRCDCKGMCVKKCNCKSNGNKCTDDCGCNKKKTCKNRPDGAIVTASATATATPTQRIYQETTEEIQAYVAGLEPSDRDSLCVKLLENVGGTSHGKLLLEEGPPPPPSDSMLGWCKCGKCRPMPSPIENVCCGRRICVTNYQAFHLACMNPNVLHIAIRNNADWRADPVVYNNTSFRKAAYRQYILWVYEHLGRGNRRVAPSCVVLHIRATYPSADGTYMGFRES